MTKLIQAKRRFSGGQWAVSKPRTSGVILAMMLGMIGLCATASTVTAQDGGVREGAPVTNNLLPLEARGITVEQKLGDLVPLDLPLLDSFGRKTKTGYYIDSKRPTIITLNYSNCPMLCNIQLNRLADSLNKLELKVGEDFQILTVSIDPKETTERVRETKQKYIEQLTNHPKAAEGWEFCTAKQPVITKLADVLGFRYRYDARSKEYNHPAMLAFISPEGVISRYSLAIDFPTDQLKLALVEAGEGTVGSPVDQFIQWCYSYDPDSNSYTWHAWRLMRLGGAAMIGLMLACLAPYWLGRKGGVAVVPEDAESMATGNEDEQDVKTEP
ncbi:electron transport protein SCO1/SenC [Rhodopirellula maiorica SM1]|uniref:Electron transport protein SCO1/SenC n=1 Tax=Rhodopirellula maiorica SM1 TaxID=1265738 RepID=M5RTR0_9BACT|nr:SCO family protein [Rhodopirellula maiorica]EMI22685.1 electron transport protein SCO1/SenC [Rhodopirellula maiorica SM1]